MNLNIHPIQDGADLSVSLLESEHTPTKLHALCIHTNFQYLRQ